MREIIDLVSEGYDVRSAVTAGMDARYGLDEVKKGHDAAITLGILGSYLGGAGGLGYGASKLLYRKLRGRKVGGVKGALKTLVGHGGAGALGLGALGGALGNVVDVKDRYRKSFDALYSRNYSAGEIAEALLGQSVDESDSSDLVKTIKQNLKSGIGDKDERISKVLDGFQQGSEKAKDLLKKIREKKLKQEEVDESLIIGMSPAQRLAAGALLGGSVVHHLYKKKMAKKQSEYEKQLAGKQSDYDKLKADYDSPEVSMKRAKDLASRAKAEWDVTKYSALKRGTERAEALPGEVIDLVKKGAGKVGEVPGTLSAKAQEYLAARKAKRASK